MKFFVKIATDPDIDPVKCVVGMACAAQAVTAGHDVDVFFAAGGVRHLEPGQFEKMAKHSCLLYTSPSPRDQSGSRMPSSA